ncbi:MAG: hypothetical protein JNJ73_14170 [Hyphomonadaceae bacterium]|nr:hypothetical protein [Hyphomonadaceae bacterium]
MTSNEATHSRGAFASAFEALMAEAAGGGVGASAAAKRAAALALELDAQRAEAAFARLCEIEPGDAVSRLALAQLRADRGELAAARGEAARAFQDAADDGAKALAAFTLGEIAMARGDREEAKTGYAFAMKLQQRVLTAYPDDFDALRHFARARQRTADMLAQEGDAAGARDGHAEALAALEALSQRREARLSLAEDLAIGCARIAALSEQLREPDVALRFANARCGWLQRLAEGEPDAPVWRHDLAEALEDRAGLDLAAERWAEGLQAADGALRLRVKLAAAAPTSAPARRALSRSWSLLAEAASRAGDMKRARAAAEHSRAMIELEGEPAALMEALLREGRLALRDGDLEPGRLAFKRVCETAQAGTAEDLAQRRIWLADAWEGLGDVGIEARRFPAAQDAYARARVFRGNADPHHEARLTLKLGEAALGAHEVQAAQQALSETCALRLAILDGSPGDRKHMRDLAVGLERLGLLAQALGDIEAARDAWMNELALADLMRAQTPDDENATRFCAVVCAHLATLGDVEALRHRDLALMHLDTLVAMGRESDTDRMLRARLVRRR